MQVIEYWPVKDIPMTVRRSSVVNDAARYLANSHAHSPDSAMSMTAISRAVKQDRSNLLKLLEKRPGFIKVKNIKQSAHGHNKAVLFYLAPDVYSMALRAGEDYPTHLGQIITRNQPYPKTVALTGDDSDNEPLISRDSPEAIKALANVEALKNDKPVPEIINGKPTLIVAKGPAFTLDKSLACWRRGEDNKTLTVPVYIKARDSVTAKEVFEEIEQLISVARGSDTAKALDAIKAVAVIAATLVNKNLK